MLVKALCLLLLSWTSATAFGQRVLIIYDSDNDFLEGLITGLEGYGEGLTVTKSETSETGYDGTNPAPDDFDAIIHLNGTTYATETPTAGQEALVEYVRNGGTYIGTSWASYELSLGRMTSMQDLILIQRITGTTRTSPMIPAEGEEDHPLMAELDLSHTFTCTGDTGTLRTFEEYPAKVLLQNDQGEPVLTMRELEMGRSFSLRYALNYATAGEEIMVNPFLQRFLVAVIKWSAQPRKFLASHHTCLLKDGIRCFGLNAFGQLGLGDTDERGSDPAHMGDNLPAVNLGSGFEPVDVQTGGLFTCALAANGKIKCWGANEAGQLGLEDMDDRGDEAGEMGDSLPAVNLGTGYKATSIALGRTHACAVLEGGAVKCWGANDNGQLGLGDMENRGDAAGEMGDSLPAVNLGASLTATAVVAGDAHTCVLLANKAVKCWGENSQGQLGLGDTELRGTTAASMGDALPMVELGDGVLAKAIAAGDHHSCVTTTGSQVKCWGMNSTGQLGIGSTENIGDNATEMGNNLASALLGAGQMTEHLTCGGRSCCSTLVQKTIKCWGANRAGQLGLGDTIARGTEMESMGENLPFVDFGELSRVDDVRLAKSHTCASSAGQWKCWGSNSYGNLGAGHKIKLGGDEASTPVRIPYIDL